MKTDEILSPLSHSNSKLKKIIASSWIIEKYQNSHNIDVSEIFKNIDEIQIRECEKTSYKFYYPTNIDGNSEFYEHFQKFEWYYSKWKWEHQIALEYINKKDKVLEVGCANGDFLEYLLKNHDTTVTGLELNKSCVTKSKNKGLNIHNELIEEHVIKNKEKYDVVCSFQVLEHIYDVHSFLKSKIECLKPKGKLIISVPNNDSFLKYGDEILNFPPHHMGLWDQQSLSNLENIYKLKLENIKYEPLQDYHFNFYEHSIVNRYLKSRMLQSIYYRAGFKKLFQNWIKKNHSKIKGHSILIVFSKI